MAEATDKRKFKARKEKLSKELKELETFEKISGLEDKIEELIPSIKKLESDFSKIDYNKGILNNFNRTIGDKERSLERLNGLSRDLEMKRKESSELKKRIKSLSKTYKKIGSEDVDKIEKEIVNMNRKIEDCHTDSRINELKEIEDLFGDVRKELENKRDEVEPLTKERMELERKLYDLGKQKIDMEELSRCNKRYAMLNEELGKMEEALKEKEKIEAEVKKDREEAKRLEKELERADETAKLLDEKRDELKNLMQKIEGLRKEIEE